MIHYYVNEKKRTVIAVLKNTQWDEVNSIIRRGGGDSAEVPIPVIEAAMMPEEFRTEVVCHPDDKFDIEIGKRIAKKRVLDNYDKSRKKAHKRAQKVAKRCSDALTRMVD